MLAVSPPPLLKARRRHRLMARCICVRNGGTEHTSLSGLTVRLRGQMDGQGSQSAPQPSLFWDCL